MERHTGLVKKRHTGLDPVSIISFHQRTPEQVRDDSAPG